MQLGLEDQGLEAINKWRGHKSERKVVKLWEAHSTKTHREKQGFQMKLPFISVTYAAGSWRPGFGNHRQWRGHHFCEKLWNCGTRTQRKHRGKKCWFPRDVMLVSITNAAGSWTGLGNFQVCSEALAPPEQISGIWEFTIPDATIKILQRIWYPKYIFWLWAWTAPITQS